MTMQSRRQRACPADAQGYRFDGGFLGCPRKTSQNLGTSTSTAARYLESRKVRAAATPIAGT
jgi:hypothetical protein